MLKRPILVFLALACFRCFPVRTCHAENTAFLIEKSPYTIHRDLLVREGETFTAEPGVVIEMAQDTSIVIDGRVEIKGYARGGEVIFKAVGPSQNYHKGFWNGLVIRSKEKNVLDQCVIQHAKTGIMISAGACATLSRNIITQNKTGLQGESYGQVTIERNSFLGNFNDILLNACGGNIGGNFFQGSVNGIGLTEAYPVIKGNVFLEFHQYALVCDNRNELSVDGNWWGSPDTEMAAGLISVNGKGRVILEPVLKEPPKLQ